MTGSSDTVIRPVIKKALDTPSAELLPGALDRTLG
jgi:hypothetical protein